MDRRRKVIEKTEREGEMNGVKRYLSYLFHKNISMNTKKTKKK
jgi:hypothetical protein